MSRTIFGGRSGATTCVIEWSFFLFVPRYCENTTGCSLIMHLQKSKKNVNNNHESMKPNCENHWCSPRLTFKNWYYCSTCVAAACTTYKFVRNISSLKIREKVQTNYSWFLIGQLQVVCFFFSKERQNCGARTWPNLMNVVSNFFC